MYKHYCSSIYIITRGMSVAADFQNGHTLI
jgi:hypothetical protein